MPIYEYICDACGHTLEALQKISDDPLKQCPDCQQERLRKKVSAAAFRLKGGGWYETDFKSGEKKNLAGDQNAKDGGDKKAGDKKAGDNGGDKAAVKKDEAGSSKSSDKKTSSGAKTSSSGGDSSSKKA